MRDGHHEGRFARARCRHRCQGLRDFHGGSSSQLSRFPQARRALQPLPLAVPAQRWCLPAAVGKGGAMAALGTAHRAGCRALRRQFHAIRRSADLLTMTKGDVELVALRKEFAGVVAVAGIDLHIAGGEFFSLLGPSGCGKTTTLRMIAGFEQPTSGSILIDGVDVARTPPHKRPVNTVFKSEALFPLMTVYDNVAFGLAYVRATKGEIEKRVRAALAMVRLTAYEKRRPAQLSGGQQQRVALARALVLNPAVLLLDEPLGALDAKLRKALQLELKSLQEQLGITFVYVTHDQEEALTMSDRLAVMADGRVEQIGTPDEVYEEPATSYVADFLGLSNL